jgi:ankyrin repeat protein
MAVNAGNYALVRRFIELGADINKTLCSYAYLLMRNLIFYSCGILHHQAAIDCLQFLREAGVNMLTEETFLEARYNGSERFRTFLRANGTEQRSSPSGITDVGRAAFIHSVHEYYMNMINLLLELSLVQFNRQFDSDGDPLDEYHLVLHAAVEVGDIQTIEKLLRHGSDINQVHETVRSLLQWAASFGNNEVVDLLLRHGADVNAPAPTCVGGATALQVASAHDFLGLAHQSWKLVPISMRLLDQTTARRHWKQPHSLVASL